MNPNAKSFVPGSSRVSNRGKGNQQNSNRGRDNQSNQQGNRK